MIEQILITIFTIFTPIQKQKPIPTINIKNNTHRTFIATVVFDYNVEIRPRLVIGLPTTPILTTIPLSTTVEIHSREQTCVCPPEYKYLGCEWKMEHALRVHSINGDRIPRGKTHCTVQEHGGSLKRLPE